MPTKSTELAYFKQYPLGHSINGSPHSVCVSLPTMADVIAYEEKNLEVLNTFAAGYPRFFRNPLISALARRLADKGFMDPLDPLLPTRAAAVDLCRFVGIDAERIVPVESIWTVRVPDNVDSRKRCRAFLQHTGCGLSSREAEALLERQFGIRSFDEKRSNDSPEENYSFIRKQLHNVYGTAAETDIYLFRSGMNAFYTGFRALQSIQMDNQKDIWIQLGWLYVDTNKILESFALPEAPPLTVFNVLDLGDLKDVLAQYGRRVAGIVTEVPTNPLVQTPDLAALRSLADKYKAALILDPTLVSPHNVNILSYSDLHINSLTKYAASEADVMMGALALNADSRFYDDLHSIVSAFGTAPSSGDLARMAAQIGNYEQTIRRVNATTVEVAAFLENHSGVDEIFWARTQPSGYNYNWLQHLEAGPGSILSFTTRKPLAEFYDPSGIVKSPSFGTRFTMMCPFMYLAHYELAGNSAGRAQLREQGINPDLIRLSVGLEPAEAIIAELDRTL